MVVHSGDFGCNMWRECRAAPSDARDRTVLLLAPRSVGNWQKVETSDVAARESSNTRQKKLTRAPANEAATPLRYIPEPS